MKEALTFDDVALVPKYNNIRSRTIPSLETNLTSNTKTELPIIPANMESVMGTKLAKVIREYKGISIFHRFTTLEQKVDWIRKFPECFMSIGVNDPHLDNILDETKNICIDIAHGHDRRVLILVEKLAKIHRANIIVGNVCTSRATQDLINAGASAIKVGIGPGSVCTTRMRTGFGVPQFTAIQDCYRVSKDYGVPLIADGGIRNSRDIVLALAAGADTVMTGRLFADTIESASFDKEMGRTSYRGQASKSFQEDYYGELKKGTVPEGESTLFQTSKSAKMVIDDLLGGVLSGLTYGGGKTIIEMRSKAEFVRVTPTYLQESNTRLC